MTIVTAQMSVSADGYYAGPEHTGPQPWLEGTEAAGFFRVTRWVIDADIRGFLARARPRRPLSIWSATRPPTAKLLRAWLRAGSGCLTGDPDAASDGHAVGRSFLP